jgi:hypothetical protein
LALLLLPLLLLSGLWAPNVWAGPVTVRELAQLLVDLKGKRDGEAAKALTDLELTERASPASLTQWEPLLAGPRSRQQLMEVVDASAFLQPPASEIPDTAAPDLAAQRKMMSMTIEYVKKTVPLLPNFFATRETTRFVDDGGVEPKNSSRHRPLHFLDKSSFTVLFRDGKEVVDTGAVKKKRDTGKGEGLVTQGVFGPILAIVITDAALSKLFWSHWEQDAGGERAVFRYEVPQTNSQYNLQWCCVLSRNLINEGSLKRFNEVRGYHGEIAVNPEDGTILRLTLEADLGPNDPIRRAALEVEYGPVEIGEKVYLCPLKSVAISVAPTQIELEERLAAGAPGPMKTSLNDAAFLDYHLFRAESRMLTGDGTVPEEKQPGTAPAEPPRSPQR